MRMHLLKGGHRYGRREPEVVLKQVTREHTERPFWLVSHRRPWERARCRVRLAVRPEAGQRPGARCTRQRVVRSRLYNGGDGRIRQT
jgi:hypothetical protein